MVGYFIRRGTERTLTHVVRDTRTVTRTLCGRSMKGSTFQWCSSSDQSSVLECRDCRRAVRRLQKALSNASPS